MRSKPIVALVILNVLLLASLCFHNVFTRSAHAIPAGANMRASDYLMISGDAQGVNSGLVYIVDTRNALLTARSFDGTKMVDMPAIDLARIFRVGGGAGAAPIR
ncbi:MAG TPA: hypothetical protein VFC78_08230 [Tepidisphaeraceae bacterium]|nr:hypothetical protein [Tepidisphaeraceae bacterium]